MEKCKFCLVLFVFALVNMILLLAVINAYGWEAGSNDWYGILSPHMVYSGLWRRYLFIML